MSSRLYLASAALCLLCLPASTAQVMSLQQVVDRAVDQSLGVENAEQELDQERVNLRQSKLAQYPTLSAEGIGGYQFGLNVDPTTNSLKRQSIGFMRYSLDAGVTLYGGGRIRNTISRNEANLASAEATVAASRQDIALRAAQLYLEALLAEEALGNAESREAQFSAQLRTMEARISAGLVAPVERFELEAAVARQQQGVVAARNARSLALLRLSQLMRMPADQPVVLANAETLDLDAVQLAEVSAPELLAEARTRQPRLRAAEFAEQAAEFSTELARAGLRPSLSAFGQANTRYSSSARSFLDDGTFVQNDQKIVFNGQEATIGFLQPNVTQSRTPIGQQFNDFFGQSVGLSLRVPIFNQGLNNAAVSRAQSLQEQARIQRSQAELDFRIEVDQALLNAQNARSEVVAARRTLAAAQAAYDAATRRLELGSGSDFDLSDQQLLLEQAQIALLRARYQYVFNAKVIDFYLGRPLAL